jgi:hypothetical protein
MNFFGNDLLSLSSAACSLTPQPPLPVLVIGKPRENAHPEVRRLSASLQFPIIRPADLMEREGLGLGLPQDVQALVREGAFVPEMLMQAFLLRRLQAPDCARGFILDGYPQTLDQAADLQEYLRRINAQSPVIILLSAPESLPSGMRFLLGFYSASRVFQLAASEAPCQIADNIEVLLSRQSRCFAASACVV